MRLLLIRHGQTEGNISQRFQDGTDRLTALGLAQARATAAALAVEPDIGALYASPLDRAATTARIIGAAVGRTPLLVPDLAETDVGQAANLTAAELQARFPEFPWGAMRDGGLDIRWPGGETGREVRDRVLGAWHTIVERHRREAGAVVVVSHGGPLAWITTVVRGESRERWPIHLDTMGNCSICELSVPADATVPVAFARWDDRAHLRAVTPEIR